MSMKNIWIWNQTCLFYCADLQCVGQSGMIVTIPPVPVTGSRCRTCGTRTLVRSVPIRSPLRARLWTQALLPPRLAKTSSSKGVAILFLFYFIVMANFLAHTFIYIHLHCMQYVSKKVSIDVLSKIYLRRDGPSNGLWVEKPTTHLMEIVVFA